MPSSRISSNSGRGSPSSTCTVQPSAPASANAGEQHLRVVDHQVAVEEQIGVLAQRLHDRRPDREVRHVVAVHAVDVQQVGLGRDARDVGREVREVGGEDRGRNLHRRGYDGVRLARRAFEARATNMPSVRASDGSRIAPRPVRPPRRAGRRERDEARAARRRGPRVDAERLVARERADRVHEPAAGPHRVPRPPRAARAAARRGRRRRCGSTRQRASGRRRSTPRPLHGASSSTRSNAPSRTGGRAPSATTGAIASRRPSRSAARSTVRTRPGCRSAATTMPVAAHALGRGRRLAARRRREVEHAVAGLRVEQRDDRPGSPGPAASRARRDRGQRARGRRSAARAARRARARPRRTSTPAPRSSAATRRASARIGFTRSVTGGGSSSSSSVAIASSAPNASTSSARSSRDARCARRSTSRRRPRATATAGPSRASARSTPLTKPRARAVDEVDRLPDRGVGRDADEELVRAEAQRGAHRAGRATRAAAIDTCASR